MQKRDGLTEEQRKLRDGMLEIAAKNGWKVETICIKMRPYKEIAEFIKKIEDAHKNARNSKLIYAGGYQENNAPAYAY